MTEIYSNIYYKHNDPKIMEKLDSLFYGSEGNELKIKSIAKSINPKKGELLAQELIDLVDKPFYDLQAESLNKIEDYSVAHFLHGCMGDEIVKAIVRFIYKLQPNVHVQAWGCGDDDPWEFWFKFENGKLVRRDDSPSQEEEEEIKERIYKWWHSDMPDTIKEGYMKEIVRRKRR